MSETEEQARESMNKFLADIDSPGIVAGSTGYSDDAGRIVFTVTSRHRSIKVRMPGEHADLVRRFDKDAPASIGIGENVLSWYEALKRVRMELLPGTRFSLNEFHAINAERARTAFAPKHSLMALVACVQEEVGELAAAILGVTGEKKRKAHLTNADVLDAVADAITYLSLVASEAGCKDLEGLLARTFNMVSERAGSALRVPDPATPEPR